MAECSVPDRRGLHLLIWVYRGGELWHETLRSVASQRHIFDSVIISCNGQQRSTLAKELLEPEWEALKPEILVTTSDISAVDHAIWSSQHTRLQEIPDSGLLVLLAEDDLLNFESLIPAIEQARRLPNSFLFGRWNYANGWYGSPRSATIQVKKDHRQIEQALIGRGQPGATLVCISGLVMTAATFQRGCAVMSIKKNSRALLTGVRSEFFFATQPNVECLLTSDSPIAFVNEHEDRESNSISRKLWSSDEALFQLWLLASSYPTSLRMRTLTLLRLVRSLWHAPSLIPNLRPAFKHFRRQIRTPR